MNDGRVPEAPQSYHEAFAALELLARTGLGSFVQGPRRPVPVEPTQASEVERAVLVIDRNGVIRAFDDRAQSLFGYPAAEAIGLDLARLIPLPRRMTTAELLEMLKQGVAGEALVDRLIGKRRDGTSFGLDLAISDLHLGDQTLRVLSVQDRAARRQSEAELRRAEARFRGLVEQIPAITFMASLDEGVSELYVSPQVESLLGFTQQEWISNPFLWYRQLHRDDRARLNAEFVQGTLRGGHYRAECRYWTRDGRIVWVYGEANVYRDEAGNPLYLQGVAFDISEIKRAEESIQRSLQEKDVLLKEIHHRVKNNLQVISSLLKLQAAHLEDKAAARLFRESHDRIRTMALVHEKLYKSGDQSKIEFADYARSLAAMLFRSLGADPARIRLRIEVMPVTLSLDTAVPLGLILNELLSNSLKHAYLEGEGGEIHIGFSRPDDEYELVFADQGRGLPGDLDAAAPKTLGLQLVRTLCDQLGGSLAISSDRGTRFRIRFPVLS